MQRLTPHLFRRLIQLFFLLTSLVIGYRFIRFLSWAHGLGPEAARPASVEAFLPISALLGLKRLVLTGKWDAFHPAGLALFICFLLMAWLLRKGFCGYVCPIGFISGLFASAGKRLGLHVTVPQRLDLALHVPKYLLLGFFLYTVLTMPLQGLEQFMRSPYNLTADARMLEFFTQPGTAVIGILAVLAVLSLVIRNPWCRYLCPYGALLGLPAFGSPLAIHRDPDTCVACGKCTAACPGAIRVAEKQAVLSPECVGCAECVGVCPVKDCLSVNAGPKRLPYWTIGLGCLALVAGCFILATLTGHWDNALPPDMARMLYGK